MQIVAACSLYTTRPINSATSNSQSNQFDQQFDPTTYANSIWASKVVPTVLNKAVDIRTVLTSLGKNSDAAQLARSAVDEASKYLKTGSTGQPERQLINCVLVTAQNADQFGLFGLK